jgi:Emfourin
MRIEYKCSGGYGGLRLAYGCETDELPPEQAKQLFDLVEEAGVFKMTQEQLSDKSRTIPDDFSCRLTVLKTGKKATLSFSEIGAPGNLRRLSVHLRKLAIKNQGD